MRDNPFHTFYQFMTGQIPDQMALGGYRWFMVALYWALLAGAFAVAAWNWRRDPQQRTAHHIGLFAARLTMAGMWALGSLWKLPLPVSGGFKFWLGQSIKYSSFQWHSELMQVFLANITFAGPMVFLLEVFFTASLMLGAMVRVSGTLAALFTLNLLVSLYNDPGEWPWTYVGIIIAHLLLATVRAGRSLGVDNLVARGLLPVSGAGRRFGRVVRWACAAN